MSSKSYEENWTGTVFDSSGATGTYILFQDNTDNLLGKVLTIIDATYTEQEQRNAVKSLIKEVFSNYRGPNNWTYNDSIGTGGTNYPADTTSFEVTS